MTYLEHRAKYVPTGLRKILYLNWPLAILLTAVAGIGFMMLYSVAGGDWQPWAAPQMKRFGVGFALMVAVAMVPIWFWHRMSGISYFVALLLLLLVHLIGVQGKGAQRWIELGSFRLQPSELMKIALVMALAAYYDWLPKARVSNLIWVALPAALILIPTALVMQQPDLGTALLLMIGGAAVMFAAGVHWAYFASIGALGAGAVALVFRSRGTSWQLIKDYQFRRIDIFLDPSAEPMGAGYHITQGKIALGSGGWTGRGFMQGTQSRLNFLPEKHTDFIFNILAEEFGFIGSITLLGLYMLIVGFAAFTALTCRDRFAALVSLGVAVTFFLYFAVNMAMVMGLAPVVGVPLPLVSYGGSVMLVLLMAFGLVQSAHVHRPR